MKEKNYISEEEFREHYEFAFNLMNLMEAFNTIIKIEYRFSIIIQNDSFMWLK